MPYLVGVLLSLHPVLHMRESQVFQFLRPNSLSSLQQRLKSVSGMAIGWGLMVAAAGLLFVERIPNFRRDFFSILPLERYAEYRIPAKAEEDEAEGEGEL